MNCQGEGFVTLAARDGEKCDNICCTRCRPTQASTLRSERDFAVRMMIVELERRPRDKGKLGQARARLKFTDRRVDKFLTELEGEAQ